MKLSVLFLICSLSMTYAAESYAQKTMISLEVRNETVGTVLEKLKKESGFDFFFNNKHVDLKRIVSVSANNNNIFITAHIRQSSTYGLMDASYFRFSMV